MDSTSRVYIAGHSGLAGSAVYRRLQANGYRNLIVRTHSQLDLIDKLEVERFFSSEDPEYVFLCAGKVGGIHANQTYPVDFLLNNLSMQNNVIESAWRHGVRGLLFLASSCIYPRDAPQPLREKYLLTGPLEPTNQPYAIAKIAGVELCKAFNRQYDTRFLSVMPTNLYGPNDHYDLENSHVLPALIRKFHLGKLAAKRDTLGIQRDEACYGRIPEDVMAGLNKKGGPVIRLWGTGAPRREMLHAEDMADGCVFLMERLEKLFSERRKLLSENPIINIGCGKDSTIRELADTVAGVVGFMGDVQWDAAMPDGTHRKLLDVSVMSELGWRSKISLEQGLRTTYDDYLRRLRI
ncbi:MAG TPA: GDP-L-fucose synthase [Syntrophobacteraceae bacterium]|nr:GDP-L-fucose synthase [Syntrophobacteraceae bacterium]